VHSVSHNTGSLWTQFITFFSMFRLSSMCTNELAANLLHQSRHVEIDAAVSWPGFPQKKSKACCKPAWTCREPVRTTG